MKERRLVGYAIRRVAGWLGSTRYFEYYQWGGVWTPNKQFASLYNGLSNAKETAKDMGGKAVARYRVKKPRTVYIVRSKHPIEYKTREEAQEKADRYFENSGIAFCVVEKVK
jgi:hypothetical protein